MSCFDVLPMRPVACPLTASRVLCRRRFQIMALAVVLGVTLFVRYILLRCWCHHTTSQRNDDRDVRDTKRSGDIGLLHSTDTSQCVTGRPCDTYTDDVELRVIVLTYNRPLSLKKLLRSLDNLLLDGDRAALEVWIDRNREGAVDQTTINVARSFSWRHGRTKVHVQEKHAGLYGQWIDTWRPRSDSPELGLILEDDISVSPMAYRWLKAVHREFGNKTDFVGTSLTSDQMEILSAKPKGPLAAPSNHTVLMYKCLGTWGFSPKRDHWRRFQDWFHQHKPSVAPHFHPYVPDASPTDLYKAFERDGTAHSMWEMWFIYYMHIEQLYAVYSNLKVYTNSANTCLCINRREVGLHVSRKGREDLCQLLNYWTEEFVAFPKNIVRLDWDGTHITGRNY